jgi:hypothetical protein
MVAHAGPNPQRREAGRAFSRDPVLRRWINPRHLDGERLRESVLARPDVRYGVADDFFREQALDRLIRFVASRPFSNSNVGSNYDAAGWMLPRDEGGPATELFFHPAWHAYIQYVTGVRFPRACRTYVEMRRHPPRSKGLWVHTDANRTERASVTGYFNRGWRVSDGGLLQFWRLSPLARRHGRLHRFNAYLGRRLDFFARARSLDVELAGKGVAEPVHLDLLDQVVPEYNRVVFLNIRFNAGAHSVTPSTGRRREGFGQWLL